MTVHIRWEQDTAALLQGCYCADYEVTITPGSWGSAASVLYKGSADISSIFIYVKGSNTRRLYLHFHFNLNASCHGRQHREA